MRNPELIAAGPTIAGSLVPVPILRVWADTMFRTIALTMFPGIWILAAQPFFLSRRSTPRVWYAAI